VNSPCASRRAQDGIPKRGANRAVHAGYFSLNNIKADAALRHHFGLMHILALKVSLCGLGIEPSGLTRMASDEIFAPRQRERHDVGAAFERFPPYHSAPKPDGGRSSDQKNG
jgi:hypothetical protein